MGRLHQQGENRDRLLLWMGLVTALSLQTKFLVVAFWVVIALAVLAVGPRAMLRRPMLWVGAAIATATAVPGLLWQARNGWPQLEMGEVVAAEVEGAGGFATLSLALLFATKNLVGIVFTCYGTWRLLRSEELRPYRFLGLAVLGVLLVFVAMSGRSYYALGLVGIPIAVAAVEICRRRPAIWWRWVPSVPVFVLSGLLAIAVAVGLAIPGSPLLLVAQPVSPTPVYPAGGWERYSADVARVYAALPAAQRERTAVLTWKYFQASPIDHYGPAQGVAEVYSPHRGYWFFGSPPDTVDTVLYVGDDAESLRPHFAAVRQVGVLDGESRYPGTPLWLAEGRREPWSRFWPALRTM